MVGPANRNLTWEFCQRWTGFAVTGDNSTGRGDRVRPLVIGGQPLHQRLASAVPELVSAVVGHLVERSQVYRNLPAEELTGDIVRAVERGIRVFVRVLRTQELATSGELAAVRESAARRAEEGVPLDTVLTAYHLGAQVCADELAGAAVPDDVGDLVQIHGLALRYLQQVTAAVAAGYLTEYEAVCGEEQTARHALLTALLEGGAAERFAARAGIRLPACYLVLSLVLAGHPDEARPDVDANVAARRKLRRLRVELEHQAREPVLSMLSVHGGVALLPCATRVEEVRGASLRRLEKVVGRIQKAAGAEVVAAAAVAAPDEVAAAVTLTREVLEVALVFRRPPGLYQLADVLLEYQLTRPSQAREPLAALLAPLDRHPELLSTLRYYVDSGLSRQRTARQLHVHPNTVDNRLRRVVALTGLDATRSTDLARVTAALAAHDARGRD